MASTFSSTEPFSSTDHNYKNYRKFWCKKVKVLSLLESNCPKASVPPFLVSSAPPPPLSPSILRPRPPLWLCVIAPFLSCSPELPPDLLQKAQKTILQFLRSILRGRDFSKHPPQKGTSKHENGQCWQRQYLET